MVPINIYDGTFIYLLCIIKLDYTDKGGVFQNYKESREFF